MKLAKKHQVIVSALFCMMVDVLENKTILSNVYLMQVCHVTQVVLGKVLCLH